MRSAWQQRLHRWVDLRVNQHRLYFFSYSAYTSFQLRFRVSLRSSDLLPIPCRCLQAAALPSGSARAEALSILVGPAGAAKDVSTLKSILDAIVNDAVPAPAAKPVLLAVHDVTSSWGTDYENIVAVADHAVTRLQCVASWDGIACRRCEIF